MNENHNAGRRAVHWTKITLIFLLLAAPSAWMIATVPPLWRDVDGYNQLIQDPRVSTFWGWGPAYGYFAKVPVFLAEHVERFVAGPQQPVAPFPALTDARIAALIATQHLALAIAAVGFVCAVSRLFLVRLVLALAWASNALFYTFVHSVGSESLSVIVVVLLVTQCLRLNRPEREPGWMAWLGLTVALFFCLLSRQINGLLIFLLPAAFLFAWLRLRLRRQHLRNAVIAMVLGLATVAIANSTVQDLARKTRFHPHSRLGFTFLWRLPFLQTLSPADRHALLDEVRERARSENARRLVTFLGQVADEGTFEPGPFFERAGLLLFPNAPTPSWEETDLALNELARAFLFPPTPQLLHAARTDFAAAREFPVASISDHLFEMTTYYFGHESEMKECAGLVTFRDYDTAKLTQLPSDLRYFHLWGRLNYNWALLGWLMLLGSAVAVARWTTANRVNVIEFAVALTAIGTLMVAVTCLLGESLPRYTLPMWQLLLLSSFLLFGQLLDCLMGGQVRRAAVRSEP